MADLYLTVEAANRAVVPIVLRDRIAELEAERDIFKRTLDKRDKQASALRKENQKLRCAMTGWTGYGWREAANGEQYVDNLQEFFDTAMTKARGE